MDSKLVLVKGDECQGCEAAGNVSCEHQNGSERLQFARTERCYERGCWIVIGANSFHYETVTC